MVSFVFSVLLTMIDAQQAVECFLQGSLISSVLIFLVLFVGYVWDQVRLYWIVRQDELQWEQERQQQVMVPQVTDCPWSPVCCYSYTL